MIRKETIIKAVSEIIQGSEFFLVEVDVRPSTIHVFLDKQAGITIGECTEISRKLILSLGEEMGEYELVVSSPGLDSPLRTPRQFIKNIGRKIEVQDLEGVKFRGKLVSADEQGFTLEKDPGKKAQGEPEQSSFYYYYHEVKKVKISIEF